MAKNKTKTMETPPSLGIGDSIEKITSKLGIKKCDACDNRRKNYNTLFTFVKQVSDFEEGDELIIFSEEEYSFERGKIIIELYLKIFNIKITANTKNIIDKLIEHLQVFYLKNKEE